MSGYCAAYKTLFSASDYTYSAQFNQFCATATTLRAMITAVFVSETQTSNLQVTDLPCHPPTIWHTLSNRFGNIGKGKSL